jgi:hypothetical protein
VIEGMATHSSAVAAAAVTQNDDLFLPAHNEFSIAAFAHSEESCFFGSRSTLAFKVPKSRIFFISSQQLFIFSLIYFFLSFSGVEPWSMLQH